MTQFDELHYERIAQQTKKTLDNVAVVKTTWNNFETKFLNYGLWTLILTVPFFFCGLGFLIAPLAFAGLYYHAYLVDAGKDAELDHFFEFYRNGRTGSVLLFGLFIAFVLGLVYSFLLSLIFAQDLALFSTIDFSNPDATEHLVKQYLEERQGMGSFFKTLGSQFLFSLLSMPLSIWMTFSFLVFIFGDETISFFSAIGYGFKFMVKYALDLFLTTFIFGVLLQVIASIAAPLTCCISTLILPLFITPLQLLLHYRFFSVIVGIDNSIDKEQQRIDLLKHLNK